jgi:hypothetical protein
LIYIKGDFDSAHVRVVVRVDYITVDLVSARADGAGAAEENAKDRCEKKVVWAHRLGRFLKGFAALSTEAVLGAARATTLAAEFGLQRWGYRWLERLLGRLLWGVFHVQRRYFSFNTLCERARAGLPIELVELVYDRERLCFQFAAHTQKVILGQFPQLAVEFQFDYR